MCDFYQEHFPEGPHKLRPKDLDKVADILEKVFSDDVLNPIFLSMIEEEDENPTFPHPENWNELTLEEKGDKRRREEKKRRREKKKRREEEKRRIEEKKGREEGMK